MAKHKVAVFCGHGKSLDGSNDVGTAYGGKTEVGYCLPITKACVKYLKASGIEVITDVPNNSINMIKQVQKANSENVEIEMSIHCDWYKGYKKVSPLYVSSAGKKLAKCVNDAVKAGMSMKSTGVVKRTDLYELNYTDMPAVILETSSILDHAHLSQSDKYGKSIAKGICKYLGVTFKDGSETSAETTKTIYRVRKTWTDTKSQKGAFSSFANAKKCADKYNLNVYDTNGKKVYEGK
jgi:N-acetylmuramoyl-L-alanine amidase